MRDMSLFHSNPSRMRPVRMLAGLALAACAMAGQARAEVYKCSLPGGGSEYRDQPCSPGKGGAVQVKAGGTASAGGGGLSGDWCEYAVSIDENSEKDTTAAAQWTFNGDQVKYKLKAVPRSGPWMPLKRVEGGFAVDHALFGGVGRTWRVVRQSGGAMLVKGPLGGYYHFRRGAC
jgi:hypothetical protein